MRSSTSTRSFALMVASLMLAGCGSGQEPQQEAEPSASSATREPVAVPTTGSGSSSTPSVPDGQASGPPTAATHTLPKGVSSAPLPSDFKWPEPSKRPAPDPDATPRGTVDVEDVDRSDARAVGAAFVRAWLSTDYRSDPDTGGAAKRAKPLATEALGKRLTTQERGRETETLAALHDAQGWVEVEVEDVTDDYPPPTKGETATGAMFEATLTYHGISQKPEHLLVFTNLERGEDGWAVSTVDLE